MFWLIQTNLLAPADVARVVETLDRLGLRYSCHRAVPFVGTIDPEPVVPAGARVAVIGSFALARHAQLRGWEPGAWTANLDFVTQRAHWGERMCNADARVMRLGDVVSTTAVFVRPTADDKAFVGQVFDGAELAAWQARLAQLVPADRATVTHDTEVVVCSVKEIWSETRTWIVDGRVVTASGYKLGDRKLVRGPDEVEPRLTDFAEECARIWSPDRAYVLDVFDTPAGPRIGEVNNLNSAGLYACDFARLAMAIEDMPP